MPVTSPRASLQEQITAPTYWPKEQIAEWVRRVAETVNNVLDGKINTVSTVTLTASVASTTISDERIGRNTIVLMVPTTANASAEMGSGTIYQTLPNVNKGAAVINHANNAQVDRTFGRVLLG